MKRLTAPDDAVGLQMWAYMKGGSPFEIAERDDGFIDVSRNTEGYFASFEGWPERQQRAMKCARGRRALDVGCGAGRVSLYLQKQGIHVAAIDTSPLAIRICKGRGVKHARLLGIEEIGRLRARFDTVVLLGNNFGLFGNVRKAKRLLKQLHRLTHDGAVLIAETVNPYKTTNPFHRRYQQRNRQRGRMPGQIRMRIRFQGHASRWFDYLLVSPEEMRDILDGTGWKVTRFIDGSQRSYVAIVSRM